MRKYVSLVAVLAIGCGPGIEQPDASSDGALQHVCTSDAQCADGRFCNGEEQCVSADELRKAADSADLAELGVPDWAVASAEKAPKGHKLEGLIAPGVYDLRPGGDAEDLLSQVLEASATRMEAAGLPSAAGSTPYSPYQILTIASIVELEAVKADFTKVASVIYNRLEINMELQMDSTVNYPLKRPVLTTKAEERAKETPWNTYMSEGLPATPICSPSKSALLAAEQPEPGDWLFFVTIDMEGTTLFTRDYEQHLINIQEALRNGVLDSAR